MNGEVSFKVGKKTHRARVTLGALEDVAEFDVAPSVIHAALQSGIYNTKEVFVVVDAALRASDIDMTARDLELEIGSAALIQLAKDLMVECFKDEGGNVEAAPETTTASQ